MSEQTRRDLAGLLIPVITWETGTGFAGARPAIDASLGIGVGGFQLIGGEQDAVRVLAKELQLKSRHPLLIGAELERGAGQQFGGATGLPPLAAIAATGDMESLRRAARLTAREARTMGVNWNLAPVCDLSFTADNPTLGTRTMGDDPRRVAPMVTAWIEACQAEGVLACAKHFPGMGRATRDPHVAGPSIDVAADILKDTDMHPFRAAISAGVASMMTSHAAYPSLDGSRAPATLSREVLQWLLRQQLKYDNLITSDAMTLVAVTGDRTVEETAVHALRAGCDVLLAPGDLLTTLDALERALDDGTLDPERVRQSVRRRLKWAQWASPPNDWRRPSGADTAWGALLADRVLRVTHGPLPALGAVTEVVVVDDDAEARGSAQGAAALVESLRASNHDARHAEVPSPVSGGPVVIALFADYLPYKERSALQAASETAVRTIVQQTTALGRGVILVSFGDPRFGDSLSLAVPTISAWSGDRVMQQAAARALVRTKK
ncbi:MAG TPA: glycoside hydrolase family 3 N-terminal domain-containing protein [Gemmatimonas sp.]|nr:glycoside hydrolase family 3 N-terminal domain-containing protein [Gemmatimonas sp.]